MRTPTSLWIYGVATHLLAPSIRLWMSLRAVQGREDRQRLGERFGRPSVERPAGRLVWLHGASVGESVALLSVAARLRQLQPEVTILFTSGTRAAADVLDKRKPSGSLHQYAPVDTPDVVLAFVNHWRPHAAIFVEGELWPNMLLACRAAGVRLALISAKMSGPSERRWLRAPESARATLGCFDLILARDDSEANRFKRLGAKVDGLIDLKFGAEAPPYDENTFDKFRAAWRGKQILLGASTHPGEDDLILDAFATLFTDSRGAVLILAPRHPRRGQAIAALAGEKGFSVASRSGGREFSSAEVFVADSLNELGVWYRLATLAIVGGSLTPGVGGHNPLEPARLGCPVFAGPHTGGWPIYEDLINRNAARRLSVDDLASELASALCAPGGLQIMADTARLYVEGEDVRAASNLDRVIHLIAK